MNLHTDRVYNRTGYDDTIYFRSEVIGVRKTSENYASDVFNLESPNVAYTPTPTAIPHMTSLVVSGRLQNAIWYYMKVRQTCPAGQRIE